LPLEYETIVVDNASGDGTAKMVREEFPEVKFIQAENNQGFSAGYNLGIREAKGRYLLLLNPDIAVLNNAILNMYEFMEANSRVGLAGPKLLNPDGKVQMSAMTFPSFWTPLYRRTFLGKLPFARKAMREYLMSDWDHGENRPVDWVLGGCMIVRKEALDKVGLLDERFFLYFDDIDWCRRFWQAGWQVYYIAEAEMVHYHRRESAENPGLRGLFSYPKRTHIVSWVKYFLKYLNKSLPQKN
jgi:GT2 family glycosyltransferase